MKNVKYFLSVCCSLAWFTTLAQNLIPNPGFETLSSGLSGAGQIIVATGWSAPIGSTGTPDLFNTSSIGPPATVCDDVGVPNNTGGNAPAHSGNGYAGISINLSNNYYEYITMKLNLALTPGEIYILDLWVRRADSSRYAINRIGALMSTSMMTQVGSAYIPIATQFENPQLPNTGIWKHLFFTPYVASGGEQYITFGVFRAATDPALSYQDFGAKNSGCNSYDNSAYIYIDDVNLVPFSVIYLPPVDTSYVCPYNYTTTLEPVATNIAVTWTNQFGNVIENNGGSITVPDSAVLASGGNVPGAIFTYYCSGSASGTDSVKLVVVNPPSFDLGLDTTYCESDSVKLDATVINGVSFNWSNGDSLPFTYITDTGHYYVTVNNQGCALSDSIYFYSLLPNPPISLGEDSLFCFFNFDSLRLNATTSDAVSYFWRPTGEFVPEITVKYAGYYSVAVTRENGCIRTQGFEVNEVCPPGFYAPNAFTPDGDGINDIFSISVNNYASYTLRIFDRFGQLLYLTNDPEQGWDGTFNGKKCPIGVYTYKINVSGLNSDGEKESNKTLGTLTLYR